MKKLLAIISVSLFASVVLTCEAMERDPEQRVADLTRSLRRQPGVLRNLSGAVNNPWNFITNNAEFFAIFRPLLRLPDVLLLDSTDPTILRVNASLSAILTDVKIAAELSRCSRVLYAMAWHQPKILLYTASSACDLTRVIHAEEIAMKNQKQLSPEYARFLKVNQGAKLGVETALRILAFLIKFNLLGDQVEGRGSSLVDYLSEVADFVELWNLLTRINTDLLPVSKIEANVNLVMNRFGEKQEIQQSEHPGVQKDYQGIKGDEDECNPLAAK